MRVAIPFDISQDVARERLKSRSHEIGDHIPGGVARVATEWPHENRMNITITTMGQTLQGFVNVEQNQLVFEIALPMALSFLEPMISSAIRQQGQKMLA